LEIILKEPKDLWRSFRLIKTLEVGRATGCQTPKSPEETGAGGKGEKENKCRKKVGKKNRRGFDQICEKSKGASYWVHGSNSMERLRKKQGQRGEEESWGNYRYCQPKGRELG